MISVPSIVSMDFQSACCCPQCTRTYAAVPMAPRLASAAMLSESLSRLRTAERKEAVTCASKPQKWRIWLGIVRAAPAPIGPLFSGLAALLSGLAARPECVAQPRAWPGGRGCELWRHPTLAFATGGVTVGVSSRSVDILSDKKPVF